jgi:hypothetical protein
MWGGSGALFSLSDRSLMQSEFQPGWVNAYTKAPESRLFGRSFDTSAQVHDVGHRLVQIRHTEKHEEARGRVVAVRSDLHRRSLEPTFSSSSQRMEGPTEELFQVTCSPKSAYL